MASDDGLDLWKKARRHIDKMSKALQEADSHESGSDMRRMLLNQAAQDARAYAVVLENVAIAEQHHQERGWSAYNISMLDGSAEPIIV